MRFANTKDHGRCQPKYSGQKGTCPSCGKLVTARCGEIYVWHWAHKGNRECDPWQEHETEWHREWKNRFPESWQEIVVDENGERHIADVKNPDGTVLEFQNSSISSTTVKIRERFYGNMLWVVNAQNFEDNLRISSLVTSRLKELAHNRYAYDHGVDRHRVEEIEMFEQTIRTQEYALREAESELSRLIKAEEKYSSMVMEKETFSARMVEGWITSTYYDDYEVFEIAARLRSLERAKLKDIITGMDAENKIMQANRDMLDRIGELRNFKVDDIDFKMVAYGKIPPSKFHLARAIPKSTFGSLFPTVKKIFSESEFHSYRYKLSEHYFAFDIRETESLRMKNIEQAQSEYFSLDRSLKSLKQKLQKDIQDILVEKASELLEDLDVAAKKIATLQFQLYKLGKDLESLKDEIESEIGEILTSTNKAYEEEKSRIMKANKGKYHIWWKNERKTWQFAASPVFFDIGKDYLFERIYDTTWRKIMISDFLGKYGQME